MSDGAFLRALADCIVGLTMEGGGQGNTTRRRQDKSGSPVVIQALDRACLSPCRLGRVACRSAGIMPMISMELAALSTLPPRSPRMSGSGEDFRVRPGRIRSTRAGKSKSFVNQVLRAAKKAGHTASQSGAGKPTGLGRSTFGRGRLAFSRNRLFTPQPPRRGEGPDRAPSGPRLPLRADVGACRLSEARGRYARRREGAHVRCRDRPRR